MQRDDIDRLFECLEHPVSPPRGFDDTVLKAVARYEERRQVKLVALRFFALTVFSALVCWFSWSAVGEMGRSGFIELFSMLWTDSSAALSHLGDWGMAVVETLPTTQLLIIGISLYLAGSIGTKLFRGARPRFPMGVI